MSRSLCVWESCGFLMLRMLCWDKAYVGLGCTPVGPQRQPACRRITLAKKSTFARCWYLQLTRPPGTDTSHPSADKRCITTSPVLNGNGSLDEVKWCDHDVNITAEARCISAIALQYCSRHDSHMTCMLSRSNPASSAGCRNVTRSMHMRFWSF